MRLIASVATLTLALVAQAQVWDKPVVPGLTYHMEYDAALPRIVHALRYSPASASVKAVPELANGTIFTDDASKGRETVSEMVARTGAIAGINGDYFPFTGDPLGLMVREGQLLSQPVKPRAALGWGNGQTGAGIINWRMTLVAEGMDALDLNGVNQQCGQNCCVVNDPQVGLALSQKPGVCVILKTPKPALGPAGEYECEVQSVFSDATSVPVGPDALVLMGQGTKAPYLSQLKPGQKVTITVETTGLDWSKLTNVIGGGPMLVQNGHSYVDWQDEDFKADFAQKRHPRSAVGRTKEGDLWFVAVDGRQAGSVGASLDELAAIMLRLGCTDAINLDGGGSTAMNLFGMVLNRPSEKEAGQELVTTERKVANAVLLYASPPPSTGEVLKIASPPKLTVGAAPDLTVVTENGSAVPNSEVFWFATGAGFIDQGGRVHTFAAGTVSITAFVHGQRVTASLVVEAPQPVETTTPGAGGHPSR